jgi:hypothetical protein
MGSSGKYGGNGVDIRDAVNRDIHGVQGMMDKILVCFGGGTNSTAMLIEKVRLNEPVDIILFADTGAEKPHTYDYVEMFSNWLQKQGYPQITTVKAVNASGDVWTLTDDCLARKALPSLAYGYKTCSLRWKLAPQDKHLNNHPVCKLEWKAGRMITKLVGFDWGESHRVKSYSEDTKYTVSYPLVDWQWNRKRCVDEILKAGLPLPGKSSCFFCPSMKGHEIIELRDQYPDLLNLALQIEADAELFHIAGLGRSYSWREFLKQESFNFCDNSIELDCGCYDG